MSGTQHPLTKEVRSFLHSKRGREVEGGSRKGSSKEKKRKKAGGSHRGIHLGEEQPKKCERKLRKMILFG